MDWIWSQFFLPYHLQFFHFIFQIDNHFNLKINKSCFYWIYFWYKMIRLFLLVINSLILVSFVLLGGLLENSG